MFSNGRVLPSTGQSRYRCRKLSFAVQSSQIGIEQEPISCFADQTSEAGAKSTRISLPGTLVLKALFNKVWVFCR